MHANRRFADHILLVLLLLFFALTVAGIHTASADQTLVHSQTILLNVGDALVIRSNTLAIQQLVLEGNLSATTIEKPSQFPADYFQMNASQPGNYELRMILNQPSDYDVNLYVMQKGTGAIANSTSYYVSGGSLELDVTAYFNPVSSQTIAEVSSVSASEAFANWMGNFGRAFPLWVKTLYLLLGVQFMTVGGLWIRRESARKEAAAQPLDAGNKAYLWLDVTYKFLLASFLAIVFIMGGELALLFVLRFMFLVSISLLSLWDLFVVGFAAGAVIMVYLIRTILEKAFDLKPFEGE